MQLATTTRSTGRELRKKDDKETANARFLSFVVRCQPQQQVKNIPAKYCREVRKEVRTWPGRWHDGTGQCGGSTNLTSERRCFCFPEKKRKKRVQETLGGLSTTPSKGPSIVSLNGSASSVWLGSPHDASGPVDVSRTSTGNSPAFYKPDSIGFVFEQVFCVSVNLPRFPSRLSPFDAFVQSTFQPLCVVTSM